MTVLKFGWIHLITNTVTVRRPQSPLHFHWFPITILKVIWTNFPKTTFTVTVLKCFWIRMVIISNMTVLFIFLFCFTFDSGCTREKIALSLKRRLFLHGSRVEIQAQGFSDRFLDAAPHPKYVFPLFELNTQAAFAKAREGTKGRFCKRVVLVNVNSFRFFVQGNIRLYPRSALFGAEKITSTVLKGRNCTKIQHQYW